MADSVSLKDKKLRSCEIAIFTANKRAANKMMNVEECSASNVIPYDRWFKLGEVHYKCAETKAEISLEWIFDYHRRSCLRFQSAAKFVFFPLGYGQNEVNMDIVVYGITISKREHSKYEVQSNSSAAKTMFCLLNNMLLALCCCCMKIYHI